MDQPTWSDTLRAAFASSCSCLPCFTSPALDDSGDDERSLGATEHVLIDADGSRSRLRWDGGDDDAISLHSHLGARERRKPLPSRRIGLFGFSLFGASTPGVALPEDVADPLHATVPSPSRRSGGSPSSNTLAALLESAAADRGPEALTDAGVTQAEDERRARRRARKEMRTMAAAAARADGAAARVPTPLLELTAPPPHLIIPILREDADGDEDEDPDLDGGAYARRAPRSELSTSESESGSHSRSRSTGSASNPPYPHPHSPTTPRSKLPARKRSARSKSSATSSTLASPPPSASGRTFAFPAQKELSSFGFDGTPGGFDEFDGTPGGLQADDAVFDGTPGGFD